MEDSFYHSEQGVLLDVNPAPRTTISSTQFYQHGHVNPNFLVKDSSAQQQEQGSWLGANDLRRVLIQLNSTGGL